jgi:hypothetical protein
MVVNGWGMGKGLWFQNIPASHRLFLFCLNQKHQISVKIWKTKVQGVNFIVAAQKAGVGVKKNGGDTIRMPPPFFLHLYFNGRINPYCSKWTIT